MIGDDLSKFKFYSIGIVVKDKVRNTDIIIVHPSETLPTTHGSISDYKRELSVQVPNTKGVLSKEKITAEATMEATWLGFGTGNQSSSPDVVANESVMLFQFAESMEFYWEKFGREPTLRRLEDVLYLYGGTPVFGVELSRLNSYWMEVNTFEKYIQLHTSKSNGEKYGYDIKIDTMSGMLSIQDDAGNSITLNSNDKEIKFKCKTFTVEAETVNIGGKQTLKGDVTSTGKLTGKGGIFNSSGELTS